MSVQSILGLSPEEVKRLVAIRYNEVATNPEGGFNFPVGRKFAESVGYAREFLEGLPLSLHDSFTGAGNPQPFIDLKPGERVLDLGCGGGLDLYIYSQKVGPRGFVFGVDLSEEMVKKAAKNMEMMGVGNCRVICAPSDAIPLEDGSLDVVASNGVYNLSPDKDRAFREVYRVLRRGGRVVLSEIVLREPLPEGTVRGIKDWFRCIGGALTEELFVQKMTDAGFRRITVLSKGRNARTGHPLALSANIIAYNLTSLHHPKRLSPVTQSDALAA